MRRPSNAQGALTAAERERWIRIVKSKQFMAMAILSRAPEHILADAEIMLAAISRPDDAPYGDLLEYSPMELRADRQFIWQCVEHDAGVLDFVPPHLRADWELILHAAIHNGFNALRFCANDLKSDLEIITAAIRCSDNALGFVPQHLRRHPSVIAVLMEKEDASRMRELNNERILKAWVLEHMPTRPFSNTAHAHLSCCACRRGLSSGATVTTVLLCDHSFCSGCSSRAKHRAMTEYCCASCLGPVEEQRPRGREVESGNVSDEEFLSQQGVRSMW